MRNNDVITLTRQNLGQWASYAGGIGLVIGIIGFIWQGGFTSLVLAALAVGAGGILLWALLSPRDFMNFLTGRQARAGTLAVFSSLLMIGIAVLVYTVVQRSVITVDMTEAGRFTLSSATENVLKRVARPIQITGFYSPNALQQREIDDQFFRLYSSATDDLIRRVYIDPDENPAMAELYQVAYDGAVYISYLTDDGEVDFNTLARVPSSSNQERDMTEAIARLLISGSFKVYFETSHGELDPLDGSQQGLSGIHNGIQESGLITAELNLADLAAAGQPIPGDASAVIMARPLTQLSSAEINVLDAYLRQGGGLFIMADVLFNDQPFLSQDSLFNQYLWQNFGIRVLDAAVVDIAASERTPLDIISAVVYGATDIGARLDPENNTGTLFSIARALEVNDSPPPDTANGRVILSSDQSYGETNLRLLGETNTYQPDAAEDIPGPLTTVAWGWNQDTNGRVLLVGDSDFATNGLVLTGGNGILFTDGLSWLSGLGEQIQFGFQAYSTGLPLVFIDTQTLDTIAFVTEILMPGLVLVAGFVVWVRRVRG
ncbi:MAG: GldG family protein [Anaerolineaceae bacterium]|nr:GldG family protein [Anaerolineaceae bacterium]